MIAFNYVKFIRDTKTTKKKSFSSLVAILGSFGEETK